MHEPERGVLWKLVDERGLTHMYFQVPDSFVVSRGPEWEVTGKSQFRTLARLLATFSNPRADPRRSQPSHQPQMFSSAVSTDSKAKTLNHYRRHLLC